MTMPLSFRSTVIGCLCALAVVPTALGQTYTANGGQYAILPAIPGDQIRPQMGLNPAGGYLVWEDNTTDGRGEGVSALALNNNFSSVGAHFRVNQIGAGDQEFPQVVLLNNRAGAVFTWQGGQRSYQHIYARFLSSSPATNFWLGGDVLVNTFTNNFQINPTIATLTNGNVIVAWSSFNEFSSDSLQDVYAQVLSPTGAKLGGEFLVNQFTSYNQRTPAVAALNGGGFVLAWVSEQERFPNSVDIYGRLFNADGSAAGAEFLVNTSTNVCANPSVAAAANGGFAIAWSEKSMSSTVQTQALTGNLYASNPNGWDVYVRSFSSAGSGGAVQLVNSFTFGDQYAPKISAIGNNYLEIWTSLGQDGSWEGVYGQFLASDGSAIGSEFLVNTTTIGRQIYPAVASDGSQRFLTAWSSFGGPSSGFDLFAQLYAPSGYVPSPSVATYGPVLNDPYPDPSLIDDTPFGAQGGLIVGAPTMPFPVADPTFGSNTLAKAIALAQGNYNGLFYDPNGVAVPSAGYVSLKLTAKGRYSGKILLAGHSYSISGYLNPQTGLATTTVNGPSGPLTIQLQLDLSGGNEVRAQVIGDSWTAQLQADRQVVGKAASPTAFKGNYTMIIPPSEEGPGGDGYGTVQVDAAGNLKWSGVLADGTKVSQSSAVSSEGIWALYVPLYGGQGSAMSWVQFDTNGSLSGDLVWMKPAGLVTKNYPAGFTNEVEITGNVYAPPPRGAPLTGWAGGTGSVIFSGGDLTSSFFDDFSLELRDKVSSPLTNKLSLSINASSGLFSGSALNPQTGRSIAFQGAFLLWNDALMGGGFFLDDNQSGEIFISPTP